MLHSLLYLILLAALVIGTLRWPAVAVAAVVCMFGLEQWGQSSGSLLAGHQAFTNIAIGSLVLAALCLKLIRDPGTLLQTSSSYYLVIALYGYSLLTLLWTPNFPAAWGQWQLTYPYVVTVILLAPLIVTTTDDLVAVFRWVILVGGSICVCALLLGNWGARGLIVESSRFAEEANPLAIASMAGQVFLTALLFPLFKRRALHWSFLTVILPVTLAVIVRSGSRGQLMAALLAIVVVWPIARGSLRIGRVVGAALIVAALAALAFAALAYLGNDSDRWQLGRASDDVEGRVAMAGILLGQTLRSPFTVIFGLGTSAAFEILGIYPHIVPLEILSEEGVVGISLFICAVVLAVKPWWSGRLANMEPASRSTVVTLLASVVFHLVLCCKQGSMLGNSLAFMHVILLSKVTLRTAAVRSEGPALAATAPFPNLMRS